MTHLSNRGYFIPAKEVRDTSFFEADGPCIMLAPRMLFENLNRLKAMTREGLLHI